MTDVVEDAATARDVATAYAREECLGALGDVVDVTSEESIWTVEFRTHTLADTYRHRVRIVPTGRVIDHTRTPQTRPTPPSN